MYIQYDIIRWRFCIHIKNLPAHNAEALLMGKFFLRNLHHVHECVARVSTKVNKAYTTVQALDAYRATAG